MEPFKNAYNADVISQAADHLVAAWPEFDRERFETLANDGLEELELKARVAHIAKALGATLPTDWAAACDVICRTLGTPPVPDSKPGPDEPDPGGIRGWMIWPMTHLVQTVGLEQPDVSLPTLHALTQRFSAEFAIRYFLLRDPDATLAVLSEWVDDESPHVRRLVSEGTRPRLPWGVKLQPFIDDPTPTLALLDRLVDDPSTYVRRSVANHLGDIAKDDAALAVRVARRWWSDVLERQVLVKHGLRWLVKKGDPDALAVLGFGPASVEASVTLTPRRVSPGDKVEMHLELASTATTDQPLMIDYAVHHVKANGKRTPKVFKWARRQLKAEGTLSLRKAHGMRIVSTRKYYPGAHRIEVQVNGAVVAGADFELTL